MLERRGNRMGERRPWILEEATWRTVRDARYDLAVLPWGATEAHNYHLPYGTDSIEVVAVAREAAARAAGRGARVVVLPVVPFGVQTGQLDIPLCLNLNPSTQAMVLRDLVASVERAGIGKLVILNGHGGNDFKAMIRELQPATRVFLAVANWYTASDPAACFDEPGDHAGELETSVMLHVAPDLVAPLSEAGPGQAKSFRVEALRRGIAWAPRQWTRISSDTGVGNPAAATAAKGARFVDLVCGQLATFFVDLAGADPGDLYA